MFSIRFLMNERPGRTTAAAWFRRPIRDCSSLLVGFVVDCQRRRVCFSRVSFATGSLSTWLRVSISIPRKVRDVEGPSTLPGAAGRPSSAPSPSAVCRAEAHAGLPGGDQNREVVQVVNEVSDSL